MFLVTFGGNPLRPSVYAVLILWPTEVTSKETAAFEGSMAPVDKQLKEVQRDIYRRLQEAAVRRRSLRVSHRLCVRAFSCVRVYIRVHLRLYMSVSVYARVFACICACD